MLFLLSLLQARNFSFQCLVLMEQTEAEGGRRPSVVSAMEHRLRWVHCGLSVLELIRVANNVLQLLLKHHLRSKCKRQFHRRKSRGFLSGTKAPAVHDKHLQRLHVVLRFRLLVAGRTQHAAEPALTATPRHIGARTKQNNMEKAG